MIELILYCSNCGTEKSVMVDDDRVKVGTWLDVVKKAAKPDWIVQQNGDHMDIYCSLGCAG